MFRDEPATAASVRRAMDELRELAGLLRTSSPHGVAGWRTHLPPDRIQVWSLALSLVTSSTT